MKICWALAIVCSASLAAADESWTELRGPGGTGRCGATGLPVTWSATENVRWKTAIHDRGWSSPVVWGEQVWLTTATEDGKQLFAVCVDRTSGKIVHDIKVFDVEEPQFCPPVNSYASPTPVIEAGRVYVHYGTYGTAAIDTQSGKIVWTRRDLNCDHHQGAGESPVLFENLLIVPVDGIDAQYVTALDKTTGKTVWKTDRSVDYSQVHRFTRKAYCTPAVLSIDGRPQLVSPCSRAVIAYDPRTGEELWKLRHRGWSMVPRPQLAAGLIVLVIDYDRPELVAIRPGRGELGDDHVAWRVPRGSPKTATPLVLDDLIYFVTDQGVAECLEAAGGQVVWQERLGGDYSSSPVYADGRLYFVNHEGVAKVLQPGREFKLLATNALEGLVKATPAVVGKSLIVRSEHHLYCLGK
jgi:outer membrane protein assembly factor BamB